jgi:hypothetical protein
MNNDDSKQYPLQSWIIDDFSAQSAGATTL